jgi:hypothetical protein
MSSWALLESNKTSKELAGTGFASHPEARLRSLIPGEVISMCGADDPASVDEALAMLDRALAMLTAADAALLPAEVQARALRALERAEARHTAARARMLAAFSAQGGYEDDGHGSARVWLRWQTRVTKGGPPGRSDGCGGWPPTP